MSKMNNVSKVKITAGYILLLAALLFSLFFVRREMGNLMMSEGRDVQWADSLLQLLREKDANTITLLRTLSKANENLVTAEDIERLLAGQDSIIVQHRVQHKVITHRDTIVTRPKKKGFFRRLGEVFRPPKQDTAIQVKTSLEFATDTVIEPYNLVDSFQAKLREVAKQKQEVNELVQQRQRSVQRLNRMLTARIDTLVKRYEANTLSQAKAEAERQQAVRRHSINIISGIATGAVVLSAFFLALIVRDITRSNRYRRELEEARRRAEDLLATREKLMLAITHDFKAPLGSIMGYADLLSRLTVDERQRFYLDNMKTSSRHLLKLVVDLLDFHRLDLHKAEVNRVVFHPDRLLEEIRVSFEPLTSEKGLELHCSIAPELDGTYICDPLRLRQIISNLLSNAVKFTDRGSVTLTATYEQRHLVVAVADTGKGMEPSDRERIFQEFTRLPGAQGKEGFGLGLSIVRMLVQLLEGSIDVDSVPGKGSTFTVRIPIYPVRGASSVRSKAAGDTLAGEKGAGDEPEPGPSPLLPLSSFKILLIDDDRIQLTLTAAMLGQSGIESVSCVQVDELLDALRAGEFDALLTDVQMPAINGFDLLQLLRASNIGQARTIPVIAVTARSDMSREEFVKHGFAGCLHKPFTVQELLTELGIECGALSAPSATVPSPQNGRYNFAALTAFSGDDAEAARSILDSFVQETRANADRLHQASEAGDTAELAAVAHKMIPLFKLIGAFTVVDLLRLLEASREGVFTVALRETAHAVLAQVDGVLKEAEKRCTS